MSSLFYRGLLSPAAGGGGGGGGFSNTNTSPPSLGGGTGCRLYCALGHGLYTDAGTTLATAAGQLIYQWNDYSGNSNHMVRTDPAYRPATGSSAQGVFAVAKVLFIPSAVTSGVTDAEAFMLLKLDSDTATSGHWDFGGNDSQFYPLSGTIYEGAGTAGRYSFAAPSGKDAWHVYSVRTSGTDWQALKNNVALDTRTGNSVLWTSSPRVGVTFADNSWLQGQLGAIVFYAGARSSGERASIVSTLLGMAPP